MQSTGIDKFSFRHQGEGNRILIDIQMNGMPNTDIDDFRMIASNGTHFDLGRSFGVENIVFPVQVKISYRSWNKLHTSQHYCSFEFEISQTGDWHVILTN